MAVNNHDTTLQQLKEHELMQPEPYDVNFYYPVHDLETSRLKLTPFIVSPCYRPASVIVPLYMCLLHL